MIAGLDASNVNGALDFASLARQHSLSFAFFKATEGTGFKDALFPAAWRAIGELGLVRGAYHFAHPGQDVRAQAGAFLGYVKAAGLGDSDLLALDLEVNDGHSPASVAAWAQQFCTAVRAGAGRAPLVYTFIAFAEAGNCAGLGGYPLWIADPSSTPGRPRVPAPWKTWAVHQYGQQGLDLDVANYPAKAAMTAALGKPHPAPAKPAAPKRWTAEGQLSLHDLAATHLFSDVAAVLATTSRNSPGAVFADSLACYVNTVFAADTARCPADVTWHYPGRAGQATSWITHGELSLQALAAKLGTLPSRILEITADVAGTGPLQALAAAYIDGVFSRSALHVPAGCILLYGS